MKEISMPILMVSAVIVALASSITALTVDPTGNVMGYYSLQGAGTELFYEEFNEVNDMSAWTGDIGPSLWHIIVSPPTAYKDAYGSHYMSHAQSTVGYQNIIVSFAALNKLRDSGESLRMEWYDGTTWTSTGSLSRNTAWIYYSYALPAPAANNPNFAIKFVCYDWHTYDAVDWCQIDSVKITGTSIAQTCSDGTPYSQCSATKPKFCANGTLVDNCVWCGCPSGMVCEATTNACSSQFNIPPSRPNPVLRVSGNDFACSSTLWDNNSDVMNATVNWYKNGVLMLTSNYMGIHSGSILDAILKSGNLSAGEAWKCEMMATDGKDNSGWGSSNALNTTTPPCSGGGGVAAIRYEERVVLGESGGLFSRYDESTSTSVIGHGLYLSAPYSTGAIDFRLHFTDPLPVGSSRNFSRMPQINLLGRNLDVDYKTAMNGSLYVYSGVMNPPIVLYQGSGLITEENYQVTLDSVVQGSGGMYAIYKAVSQDGTTEISVQLANGGSYSFFGNKLRVQVINVGYDSVAARGYANTNLSSKLKIANMYIGDSLTTPEGYGISLNSVTMGSGGKYYAVYIATNPGGATETSAQLTTGGEYYFFGNKFGARAETVAYDTTLSKGMAKTSAIAGRHLLTDGAAFPFDSSWTVKHVDVSGTASQGSLNYIALKYGSVTSPPTFSGTVQTGLAQGVWIDGPKQADSTAKFQMRLKGLGSTNTIIGTTFLTAAALGSSGSNTTTTHFLQSRWTARDGSIQRIDAPMPDYVVIPDPGKDGSFNLNTNSRWMVVNDKVVYLKAVEAIKGNQYQIRFAIGSSTGIEIVVGPFKKAAGASAWLSLNSSVNPILCQVVLGSPAGNDVTNVTLLRSGEITLKDSFTPVCDLEPNTVPIGSSTQIADTGANPFMDLRFIQGRSSGEYAVNILIDGVVKHWPLLIVGKYKDASTSKTESATVVYDSEAGMDGLTGLIVFKDLEGTLYPSGLSINTTNKYRWINQAVPSSNWALDYVRYDTTPLSVEILGMIKNIVFLTIPESTRSAIIELSGGTTTFPIELSPLVGTQEHYETNVEKATITPDTFTALNRYTTYVTVYSPTC